MIAIRNVTKEFDVNKQKVTALSDVNFTIEKGDIFGIIGFSGAGKSTLLRMINALEVPTSGHVEIDGVNINGLSFNELRKVRKRNYLVVKSSALVLLVRWLQIHQFCFAMKQQVLLIQIQQSLFFNY